VLPEQLKRWALISLYGTAARRRIKFENLSNSGTGFAFGSLSVELALLPTESSA
jgi:hypothetical protein